MWVRSEKRYWRVGAHPLPVGASMEVDEGTLGAVKHLVDCGDLSLHETDPTPKKRKSRAKPKAKAENS
jgi:hypothetical protein